MSTGAIASQARMRGLDFVPLSLIVCAISARLLRTRYTGYAFLIRRSSDNATTNLAFDPTADYFISNNSLVSAGGTLATWMGSNDVFIVTGYDQGSFGNNPTQATSSAQLQLAIAGVLIPLSSKPAFRYNGSTSTLNVASNSTLDLDTELTYIGVVSFAIVSGVSAIIDKRGTGNAGYHIYRSGAANMGLQWNNITTSYTVSAATALTINTPYLFNIKATKASTVNFYKSIPQIDTTKSLNSTGTSVNTAPLRVGGHINTPASFFNGDMSTFILLNSVITEAQRYGIVNALRNAYGIS